MAETGRTGGHDAVDGGALRTVTTDDASDHPYSLVRTRDGLLGWVSGVLPYDAGGAIVSAREAAIDAALARLGERLALSGATLADVVQVTVYLTDMAWRDALNAAWRRTFPQPWPARTAVEVARLPKDAPIELAAVVHRVDRACQAEEASP
jgi:2-iminobutanoate/2-iminopropanoate deaminase